MTWLRFLGYVAGTFAAGVVIVLGGAWLRGLFDARLEDDGPPEPPCGDVPHVPTRPR